jgi:hypothetical protein
MQENQPITKTTLREMEVLDNPKLNKGTAQWPCQDRAPYRHTHLD